MENSTCYGFRIADRARRSIAPPALAQTWPARTVNVVVPFPPGGSVDGVARILVQKLNETLGQHFIVENRAGGAGGTVGANAVAKASPDGYTLLLSASIHVINPFLFKNVPYDVVKDFSPVTLLAVGPLIVSTTPSVPADTLKDYFDLVRKEPAKHTFGTTSIGSASHLAIELLKRDAGLDTLVVAYKGTGPASDRPDERADSAARRPDALVAAACQGRQDQGARDHQPQTPARGARHSHGRGVRHERLRVRIVVWLVGAEGPARRCHGQTPDRGRRHSRNARNEGAPQHARLRGDRLDLRPFRQIHHRRDGEIRQDHQGCEHQAE